MGDGRRWRRELSPAKRRHGGIRRYRIRLRLWQQAYSEILTWDVETDCVYHDLNKPKLVVQKDTPRLS